MARSPETIKNSMVKKLPTGFAMGKRGGNIDMILEATASELNRAEVSAAAVMKDVGAIVAI